METFDEMHAEALIAPIVLTLPAEVIESIEAYTKEYSLEAATLIPLAIKAQEHQSDIFCEAGRAPDAGSRFVRMAPPRSYVVRGARLHAKARMSMYAKSGRKTRPRR